MSFTCIQGAMWPPDHADEESVAKQAREYSDPSHQTNTAPFLEIFSSILARCGKCIIRERHNIF